MGAGPHAGGILQGAQPEVPLPQALHERRRGEAGGGSGIGALQEEAHQPRRGRHRQQGAQALDRLEALPELATAGADQGEPLLGIAGALEQLQGGVQSGEQRDAGGGHFEAAGIAVEGASGGVLVAEAAPADQGGAGRLQQPFREHHGPEPLRTAAPFVAGAGVDVGGGGRLGHRNAAQGLGRVHQQPGPGRLLRQAGGHGADRHQLAGVPEQVGEHHQAGAGREGLPEAIQHGGGRCFGAAAQVAHRQGADRQAMATGQFMAGGHHTGVFAVAQQQLLPRRPGQAPEGQPAAGGHVLGAGHPVGPDAEPAGEPLAQIRDGAVHEGPDRPAEGAQPLDRDEGLGDGLEGALRQRPLTAVIEVGLVGQGGHLGPELAGGLGL